MTSEFWPKIRRRGTQLLLVRKAQRANKGQGISQGSLIGANVRRFLGSWLAALDDFRNWLGLGLEARERS
jgi:hypothetical protein